MSDVTGKAWDSKLFRRVLAYSLPHKKLLFTGLTMTVILALLSSLRPYIIGMMVGSFVNLGLKEDLLYWTLLIVLMLVMESLGQFFFSYRANELGQFVIKDLRVQLFNHITKLRLKYFDQHPIGMLVTRAISDIETVAEIFSQGILIILGDLLKLTAVLSVMFFMNWELTLVVLIPIPLLLFSTNIFKKVIKRSFQEVRNQVSILNSFVQEHITGMNIVQIFSREKEEARLFREINNKHKKAHIKSIMAYSIFFPVVENLSAISIALLILFSIYKIGDADANFIEISGDMTAFILYVHMLFRPIRMLADRFNTLQMGMVGSSRVFKVLDTEDNIVQKGSLEPNFFSGNISFKDVTFAYKQGNPILNNISFDIKQGETLAIVGATGSGKTSIINLFCRFYEYQSGQILLDNNDLRNYSLSNLREKIAVVLQDVFLYSDTVLNNITLGDPTISLEKVKEAAKIIGAENFIENLPGKYNFDVRERGGVLSTGQRQLLSFMRSYVYNPDILILDEATSSIDTETEELIQSAIKKITKGRTSIIIAHRLSTIKNADQILVLDKGRVAEMGTHKELISKKNIYSKLYEIQFSE
ncbi:MAG: ABC transporter ATP-binding protein [Flavobacteriales bacterium]|jgi:ATP-binding cassette, subfamily B, multidrug efflux pump|nr:ABC transporter ATP-binding protein [Flavobacteriales bacterium]